MRKRGQIFLIARRPKPYHTATGRATVMAGSKRQTLRRRWRRWFGRRLRSVGRAGGRAAGRGGLADRPRWLALKSPAAAAMEDSKLANAKPGKSRERDGNEREGVGEGSSYALCVWGEFWERFWFFWPATVSTMQLGGIHFNTGLRLRMCHRKSKEIISSSRLEIGRYLVSLYLWLDIPSTKFHEPSISIQHK